MCGWVGRKQVEVVDRFDEAYWGRDFAVTSGDLGAVASHIELTGRAGDLGGLAKRLVQGRLRAGRASSGATLPVASGDAPVRLWDPAAGWHKGDRVIVARLLPGGGHRAFVGRVAGVLGARVEVELDASGDLRKYEMARPDSEKALEWRSFVARVVDETLSSPDAEMQVEGIILRHGETILSRLLGALARDDRFVEVKRRWFLSSLAGLPGHEQVSGLAWAMLSAVGPQQTDELVQLVDPPLAPGDRGLFGLDLALAARSKTFERVESEQGRGWVLCGPPPGCFTPQCAAYDPETYEILCGPAQTAGESVVRRLYELDLLRAVV